MYEIDQRGNIFLCFIQFIISTVNITVIVLEDRFFEKVFFSGGCVVACLYGSGE